MKRISLLLMAIAIALVNVAFAEVPVVEPYKKLNISSDKEKQIIEIAQGVIEKFAPDYVGDNLKPAIFKFPVRKDHPILGNNPIVVYFMKDVNAYNDNSITEIKKNGELSSTYIRRTPKYTLMVVMDGDTFNPYFIMDEDNNSKAFLPSYKEFCKDNPTYKFNKQ